MPRKNDIRRVEPPANSIVASAVNFSSIPDASKANSQASQWQDQLWFFYDCVGEFEFAANWFGNLLSRARLYPAFKGVELTEGPAFDAVQEFFGSEQGRSEALRALGLHDRVAGESYIVSYDDVMGNAVWRVVTPQVINKTKGGKWTIDGKDIPAKPGTTPLIIRTWNRHPRRSDDVTSSSRAAIPILNEIFRLTQHIDAQVSSRLASAGILFLPNEMTFAGASTQEEGQDAKNASDADRFVHELIETMSTAIVNRSDASALVPIVVTADGEHLDKAHKMDFWTELDKNSLDLRQEAIRRLGLALDMPPEILTGVADASHWQMWSADESSIKAHAEPALMRLCYDITVGYLLPAIKDVVPAADLMYFSMEADTADMRLRPNRGKEAIELYGLGQLSAKAMRRETGFDETDKPDETELKAKTLFTVGTMAATPEMSAAALEELGIALDLPAPVEDAPANQPQEPDVGADVPDAKPVPSELERRALDKDAERKELEKQDAAALVASAEQMVFRALERAGNKAGNRMRFKPENVEPSEVYLFREEGWSDAEASFMLEGAFSSCHRFADTLNVDGTMLSQALESYCRELITERKPYSRAGLRMALVKEALAHV